MNDCLQACRQVLRFGGQNTHFGGQDFCFYGMSKAKCSGHS